MRELDGERRAVAHAFGHDLPNLIEEMQAIGTVDQSIRDHDDFAQAIASGEANAESSTRLVAAPLLPEDLVTAPPFIALAQSPRLTFRWQLPAAGCPALLASTRINWPHGRADGIAAWIEGPIEFVGGTCRDV